MVAASVFWTWLTVQSQRKNGPPDRLGLLFLRAGALGYLLVGATFIAAGLLRNRWLLLAGALLMILRSLVFRWIGRRIESEA